jgi:hypothetical protein
MKTGKTGALSLGIQPSIKAAIQIAADYEMRSLANLVEVMVVDYCRARRIPVEPPNPGTGEMTTPGRAAKVRT